MVTYRGVQELAGQRVQNDVDTVAIRLAHDTGKETGISRVENVFSGNGEMVYEVRDLVVASNGAVYLGRAHSAADTDCC